MSCIIRPRNCPFNSPHHSGCSLSNRPCRAFTRSLRRALRNLARTMPTSSLGSCEKLGVVARPSIRFARRASRIGESTSWLDRFARHPASSQKHIDSSAPQTAAPTNKFILLEPSLFLPPAAPGPKQQQSRPQFRERLCYLGPQGSICCQMQRHQAPKATPPSRAHRTGRRSAGSAWRLP